MPSQSNDVPTYETCEIQLARRPDNRLNLFIAEAISPNGPYWAGASASFLHGNESAKSKAHRDFIKYLTDRRWEPVTDRGSTWWQNRFRRRWATIEKPGDSSLLSRDEYMLVGEALESAEMVVIPEGTDFTGVDCNPEERWFKVRLGDGRTAFMTEETDSASRELGETLARTLGLPETLEILRGEESSSSSFGPPSYEYFTVRRRFMKWGKGPLDEIRTIMSQNGWEFVGQQDLLPDNTPGNDRHVEMTFRRVVRSENPPVPELPKGFLDGPCFVATTVYGGYDHRSVSILREYRDARLAPTAHGRCFITVYYAVGPLLAFLVSRNALLTRVARACLDRIVSRLGQGPLRKYGGNMPSP